MNVRKWVKALVLVMVVSFLLAGMIVAENGGVQFFENREQGFSINLDGQPSQDISFSGKVDLTGDEQQIRIVTQSESVEIKSVKGNVLNAELAGVQSGKGHQKPKLNVFKQGKVIYIEVVRSSDGDFQMDGHEVHLLVEVPEAYQKDLSLKTDSGDVKVVEGVFDNITVQASSGGIATAGVVKKLLKITSESGDISVDRSRLTDFGLEAETKSGSLALPGAPEVSLMEDQNKVQLNKGSGKPRIRVQSESGNVSIH